MQDLVVEAVPASRVAPLLVLVATAVLAGCVQPEPVYVECEAISEVALVDLAFEPDDACVDEGTTVTWTNEGSEVHTVTAADGSFGSGDVAPGESFEVTFDEQGDLDVHCRYHSTVEDDGSRSGMVGVVRVEDLS